MYNIYNIFAVLFSVHCCNSLLNIGRWSTHRFHSKDTGFWGSPTIHSDELLDKNTVFIIPKKIGELFIYKEKYRFPSDRFYQKNSDRNSSFTTTSPSPSIKKKNEHVHRIESQPKRNFPSKVPKNGYYSLKKNKFTDEYDLEDFDLEKFLEADKKDDGIGEQQRVDELLSSLENKIKGSQSTEIFEENLEKAIHDLKYLNKRQVEEFKKTYEYHKLKNKNNKKYSNFESNEYDEREHYNKKYTDYENDDDDDNEEEDRFDKNKKSDNFEVIKKNLINFSNIGGYENIKGELYQIVDLLKNKTKYKRFNVRIPKGLILEGPPGNGKTLFAKALAGEAKIGFIPVSGSEFQEKYVGVGASRIRELFALAKKNAPCIIFIDEIDAVGRKRSSDGELSNGERDNTLNQLLVGLDGFHSLNGIFVVGATNRIDLLDPALIRPGRIDKKIHIGFPDDKTRKIITDMYIKGKPHDYTVRIDNFVQDTNGFSGAQIENILNEAMLNALRNNRDYFNYKDLEYIINKQMVGWQPTEHNFTNSIIHRISVHEMGHAIVGMFSQNHAKVSKVVINLSSPNSPAYTVFENSVSNIFTKESLLEHLMVLLGGRVAEEVIYEKSVTTGAINDFQESQNLAEQMILHYGMGENSTIYSTLSEHHKNLVDDEITNLIKKAYELTKNILYENKYSILLGSQLLQDKKVLYYDDLEKIIKTH